MNHVIKKFITHTWLILVPPKKLLRVFENEASSPDYTHFHYNIWRVIISMRWATSKPGEKADRKAKVAIVANRFQRRDAISGMDTDAGGRFKDRTAGCLAPL